MNHATGREDSPYPQRVAVTEYVHGSSTEASYLPLSERLAHVGVPRPQRFRLGQTLTIAFPPDDASLRDVWPVEVVRVIDRGAARSRGEPPGLFVAPIVER